MPEAGACMTTDDLTVDERRLIDAIDARADELVALLHDLVRAPSVNPPGDTRAAAQVVTAWLDQHGLASEVMGSAPDRPSVVARLPLGAPRQVRDDGVPHLLFLSHLDTVPLGDAAGWSADPHAGEVRDGRLWGRGASDAKGSAAPMLLALSALATAALSLRGAVSVGLVADEETGGAGAQYLLAQGTLHAAAVVVGETTD